MQSDLGAKLAITAAHFSIRDLKFELETRCNSYDAFVRAVASRRWNEPAACRRVPHKIMCRNFRTKREKVSCACRYLFGLNTVTPRKTAKNI